MKDAMGIIFAQGHGYGLGELTRNRSIAALPVAGRYRIIDFLLSNMVNSGIMNVGVTTQQNYQSLLDHIGGGNPWDLDRKSFGLFILPPFSSQDTATITKGDDRLHILGGILHYLKRSLHTYCVLSDSNFVCTMTYNDAIEDHISKKSDITVIYNESRGTGTHDDYFISLDKHRVTGVETYSPQGNSGNFVLGMYIIENNLLQNLVENCLSRGEYDFMRDLITKNLGKLNVNGYKHEGYIRHIYDVQSFFDFNKELLNNQIREELFDVSKSVYTKSKDRVPVKYLKNACVSNSLVADGCIIDGRVENCVFFRGVEVRKDCVIKDSIIMQDARILEGTTLSNVILDKGVNVGANKSLIGQPNFPILVGKNRVL